MTEILSKHTSTHTIQLHIAPTKHNEHGCFISHYCGKIQKHTRLKKLSFAFTRTATSVYHRR